MLPLAFGVVWLGGWPFAILAALLSSGMAIEWARLCAGSSIRVSLIMAVFAGCAVLTLSFGYGLVSLGVVFAGTLLIWGVARLENIDDAMIAAFGVPYLSGAGMSLAWLRSLPENGLDTVVFLVGIIVAMDIGAFAVGRTFGGPKMAPTISPGKTWSGLFGGTLCAGGVGLMAAIVSGQPNVWVYAVIGCLLGLAAQGGDLIESALKRRYNVKDSGTIIPGHGGLLDRLDGFLTVAPLAGLMVWIYGGSPVIWK
ncbi:MAG: phosphatidate cytidylyltransferase [Rhodospirillaceae bacterium]|nr:phosphatidate cytidylyltransferase [Rhodospirillaceae bacterium]